MQWTAVKVRYPQISIRQRDLPHWEREGGTYFVTFRLAGCIPEQALLHAKSELDQKLTPTARKQQLRRWVERYLDQDVDSLLREKRYATPVQECLLHWHSKRYRLHAWCVMPNHVHVVLTVLPASSLEQITHTWKSYTAHQINKLREENGRVWQREYFDRLLRDEAEVAKAVRYVLENPAKSGLRDWEFVGQM